MTKKEKKRFWQTRLPTIVWDGTNDRQLCEFEDGVLITDDERVIKVLDEMGYREIAMDAEVPPTLPEPPIVPADDLGAPIEEYPPPTAKSEVQARLQIDAEAEASKDMDQDTPLENEDTGSGEKADVEKEDDQKRTRG